MEQLFITPLQFEKTAYMRVSENPSEWTRDVMEQFYNAFPYFMSFPVRVEFKQRDDQKGYAVGAIHIENGSGLVIPVVIKNRELYPFDTCIYQGTVMPLNDYTINSYLSGKSPFQKTVSRDVGDITSLLFNAGNIGNTREMPMETYKTAESLLDIVLPNTSISERKLVLQEAGEEQVAEGFKQNGTAGVILKIASETHDNVEGSTVQDQISKAIDRDIWYIYKSGEFEYKGVFGNSKINDPREFELSTEDVETIGSMIKTIPMNKVASAAPVELVSALPIENANETLFLVAGDNNDYVRVASEHFNGMDKVASMPPAGNPVEIGKTGSFELSPNSYSVPFTVEHIWTKGAEKHIEGATSLEKVAYILRPGIKDAFRDGFNNVWLSPDTKFVKLGKQCGTHTGSMKAPSNKIIKTAGGYVLSGEQLGQYIGTTQPVDLHKAAWAMVQCGASEDAVTKLASLREGSEQIIWEELTLPVSSIDKIAAQYVRESLDEYAKIKSLSRNFIKEASAITDMPTVDKVLALNFVNKDTIGAFIQSLPQIEAAMFAVADMLVKARVGIEIINEGALRKVMFGLSEIVQVLKGVSTLKGDQ